MAQVIEQSGSVYELPLALIVADPKKNSRTAMSPDAVEELAETIKREGQLSPVKVEKRQDGKFELVFGYRRFAAIKLLREKAKKEDEFTSIRAEVVEPMDPVNRKLQNIAENLAREDLSPYDQALAFYDLKKSNDLSAKSISSSVGKSVSYINNLTRIYESCDDAILKRWKEECAPNFGIDKEGKKVPNIRKVCTMDWLTKLATVPRAEQEHQLHVALGLVEDDDGDDGEEGDEDGDSTPRVGAPKRASMKNLTSALEAAEAKLKASKKDGGAEVDALKGVIAGLKFAIGKTQTLKGIWAPDEKSE